MEEWRKARESVAMVDGCGYHGLLLFPHFVAWIEA